MRRRSRGLLIGVIVGAILGGALAWAVLGNDDDGETSHVKASPGDWFKLGLAVIGVARQLSDLVKRD
ncbi:MAG: hypothetical protein IT330_15915 [Anaerolineae bacterium]|nr:hypothetical protein [Anaerolineae bacterium]